MKIIKVYCASKSKYGPLWKAWQEKGACITSSWLEKYDQGRLPNQTDHWNQILEDIRRSDALLLYSQEGDVQKGALAEFGIAFALGKKLFYIEPIEGSLTAVEHESVKHYPDLETFFAQECCVKS